MNVDFLREAIRLSLESMKAGEGGPLGAVVVRDRRIVGRGWNRVTSALDPTAHAEVVAIRDACSNLGTHTLAGCQTYCSSEPCPMCLAAIHWARLDRIIYAATGDDATRAGFDDHAIQREICLPPARRSIPAEQTLRDEARAALDAWLAKPDRVPY